MKTYAELSKVLTKSELIEQVSELLKLPNGKAEQIVNCIFDSMVKALQEDDGIEIRGFGSFTVREYKSYDGRNPRTGETVHVAPKRLPFFKVGKDLRERVNRGASRAMPQSKPASMPGPGLVSGPMSGPGPVSGPVSGSAHSEVESGRMMASQGEGTSMSGNGEGARADSAPEAASSSEAGAAPRSAPSDSLSSSSMSVRSFGSSSESGWD